MNSIPVSDFKSKATNMFQGAATFAKTNWLVIVASLAMLGLGYYVYITYVANKTTYNANREHESGNPDSNKVATMMLFYVDWCPHCKTAKPEWEKVRDKYQGQQVNGYVVTFTEMNCTNETTEVSQMCGTCGHQPITVRIAEPVISRSSRPPRRIDPE